MAQALAGRDGKKPGVVGPGRIVQQGRDGGVQVQLARVRLLQGQQGEHRLGQRGALKQRALGHGRALCVPDAVSPGKGDPALPDDGQGAAGDGIFFQQRGHIEPAAGDLFQNFLTDLHKGSSDRDFRKKYSAKRRFLQGFSAKRAALPPGEPLCVRVR